jgi:hypothetical protein
MKSRAARASFNCPISLRINGDVVVELGFKVHLAQIAVRMVVEPVHRAEALGHAAALRTEQHPVHLEQPVDRGVEEKVDRLRLGHALVGGELDRIDTEERFVLARAEERFEARDDARAPRAGRLQGAESIFQELLVDRGCHSTSSCVRCTLNIRFNIPGVSDRSGIFRFSSAAAGSFTARTASDASPHTLYIVTKWCVLHPTTALRARRHSACFVRSRTHKKHYL